MLASPDNALPLMRTKSARRRRLLMPLIVLSVVGVVALLLSGAGRPDRLVGSGSTLAQPLIERSAVAYRNARTADNPLNPGTGGDWVLDGSGVEYEPVGSLGGIMRLGTPEVDFAVSDYPLSAPALAERNAAQFPIAVGSVAVVHSLPLPAGRSLRLDAAALASIYLGEITRWNDPALKKLNPDADLPDQPINHVHRADGSGSTFGFTGYLAAGSDAWAKGPGAGSAIQWPGGAAAERSSGLIAAVRDTPGSIGYAEPTQARASGLGVAEVENAAGFFVAPSADTMRAAIAGMDWSADEGYSNPLPRSRDAGAYGITVAIYAILERRPGGDTARALDYLSFLIDSYDGATEDLGYLPLPQEAADAVHGHWATAFHYTR